MPAHTEVDAREAQARTLAALSELGTRGLSESDLSYITPDLLDAYESSAEKQKGLTASKPKDDDIESSDQEYPCWIGHSPVFVSGKKWQYQNNNASNGCDAEEHLCGTGRLWTAEFSRMMKDRYCANGFKGVLGWP